MRSLASLIILQSFLPVLTSVWKNATVLPLSPHLSCGCCWSSQTLTDALHVHGHQPQLGLALPSHLVISPNCNNYLTPSHQPPHSTVTSRAGLLLQEEIEAFWTLTPSCPTFTSTPICIHTHTQLLPSCYRAASFFFPLGGPHHHSSGSHALLPPQESHPMRYPQSPLSSFPIGFLHQPTNMLKSMPTH